jgi:Tfp pilus assembly protein PilO
MDPELKEEFKNINARFDNLNDFLIEHIVTKEEFHDKLADLPTKADFSNLVSTVDGYAKQAKDTSDEIIILGEKANRLESWAKQVAGRLGVEYNP